MIPVESLKKILVERSEYIETVELINRDIDLESNASYVFTGQRRAGKTFFLYQLIRQFISKNTPYLFINFEDERLIEFIKDDFDSLLNAYYQLYTTKPVVLLDEVQIIAGWEKFCRRLVDLGYQVYVTGSNAKMVSSEIATTLGGRFLTLEIHPLSFSEFIKFNRLRLKKGFAYGSQRNEIIRLQDTYMHYGGLPESLKYTDKRTYLSNIYQKVFFGDIVTRHKLKNDFALKLLIKKIAESVNNETSFTRLRHTIESANIKVGTATLIEYAGYLDDSFLIFSISNFTAKFSEKESKKKFYFGDTGILNLFLFDQKTKLLENMVFLAIRRKWPLPVFYFKRNLETDFYIPDRNMLIQSCYSVMDFETREREVKAVSMAMKELSVSSATIVTWDEEDEINVEAGFIRVVGYWKWVLDD